MLNRWVACFLLLASSCFGQALPEIDHTGVKEKVEEILLYHAQYKSLEPLLIKRTLIEFINQIDPSKTYFTLIEVDPFVNPSEEMIARILQEHEKGHYETFVEIFDKGIAAIHRRNLIEEKIAAVPMPQEGVSLAEFKNMEWAKHEEELELRLLKVKALQLEAAEKLGDEPKEKVMQRILKRRLKREAEFLTENNEDKQKLICSLILKAAASSLDSHTSYFTPSEAEQFLFQVQQRLFGLGVQIRDDLNGFSVVKIVEGGPAAKAKVLKVGDRIIAVNGTFVVGMDLSEVVELIRGEIATPVTLTVLREMGEEQKKEEKLNLTLKRGEVVVHEARFESDLEPFGDGMIGHLKLNSFYQDPKNSSAGDLQKVINDWKKDHNLKGIILDLRFNSGGLLPQAIAVTGLFITRGVVVSVKDSDSTIQRLRDLEGKMVWDGPLVVLTNRLSASAAEIVAQTLQDYGRAVLVGDDHTFGKGTFQTFTLDTSGKAKVNPEGEYKVTRGKYYTVSGKTPQLVGAIVDVEIPGPLTFQEIGEQYTSYPLGNDFIDPQFEDDLADLGAVAHEEVAWLYRSKLQKRLTLYQPYLETLRTNTKIRLESNKHYQKYLGEIKKQVVEPDFTQIQDGPDFQYLEALNIMKDLLVLAAA